MSGDASFTSTLAARARSLLRGLDSQCVAAVGLVERSAWVDRSTGALDAERLRAQWAVRDARPLRIVHVALPAPGGEGRLRELAVAIADGPQPDHAELWLVDAVDSELAGFIYRSPLADVMWGDPLDAWLLGEEAKESGLFESAARWLERSRDLAGNAVDQVLGATTGGCGVTVDWLRVPRPSDPVHAVAVALTECLGGTPFESADVASTPTRVDGPPLATFVSQLMSAPEDSVALTTSGLREPELRLGGARVRCIAPLAVGAWPHRLAVGMLELGEDVCIGLSARAVNADEMAWIADGLARHLGSRAASRSGHPPEPRAEA